MEGFLCPDATHAHARCSRRNLSRDEITRLIGIEYKLEKKEPNDGGKGTPKQTVGKNCQRSTTAEVIAEKHGVSEKTVRNAEKYVDAIEGTHRLTEGGIVVYSHVLNIPLHRGNHVYKM